MSSRRATGFDHQRLAIDALRFRADHAVREGCHGDAAEFIEAADSLERAFNLSVYGRAACPAVAFRLTAAQLGDYRARLRDDTLRLLKAAALKQLSGDGGTRASDRQCHSLMLEWKRRAGRCNRRHRHHQDVRGIPASVRPLIDAWIAYEIGRDPIDSIDGIRKRLKLR